MGTRKKTRGPAPEFANRLASCRKNMKKAGVDAYLVTKPMDYFYLTGFTGEDSAILVQPRKIHVISDGRFDEAINQECPWAKRWMRKGLLNPEIAKVCKELKLKTLSIQDDHLTVADHTELKKLNRSTKLAKAPSVTGDLRIEKDDADLASIRKAIRIAEDAFRATCESLKVGQTENEIAARVEFEMKKRGASGPSFPTICAEGANAALPHAQPGKRKLKRGSALLLDWGARVNNYCSDLTRVVFMGSIPRKIKELYQIVLEAQELAIAAIRPGIRMCDVDEIARQHIAKAGYKEEFNHGLGHGLGLDIHEPPSVSWRSDAEMTAGMVVTVEPGIYLPGVGGVRIEDDILVTKTGHRVLSRLNKKLEDAVV